MKRQTGSILMLMMLILIVGGATVMYTLLNQSPEKLRLGQSEKQMAHLNAIKNRLLLFAEKPDLFCDTTTSDDLTPAPGVRYLPLPWDKETGSFAYSFTEFDYKDIFKFGFEELESIENLSYELDGNTAEVVGAECNDKVSVFNICTTDYPIKLKFKGNDRLVLKLTRSEICP
ncbi:hypothetical protein P8S54_01250 [Thiomicrospira sp. R3]|uniref:hypothetical protein n=1 Tax=Thiomicrospira sp. R3 TaxID=3035472 RepID=UPI00259B7E13|nr:hypothetical protein [Thiomicrospira sp. R3]WFE68953.1 hypothetical protein P8S54_01250 [Thiomicrospira sp. R3]